MIIEAFDRERKILEKKGQSWSYLIWLENDFGGDGMDQSKPPSVSQVGVAVWIAAVWVITVGVIRAHGVWWQVIVGGVISPGPIRIPIGCSKVVKLSIEACHSASSQSGGSQFSFNLSNPKSSSWAIEFAFSLFCFRGINFLFLLTSFKFFCFCSIFLIFSSRSDLLKQFLSFLILASLSDFSFFFSSLSFFFGFLD